MTNLGFFSPTNVVSSITTKMMMMEYELRILFIITILISTSTLSMSIQPSENIGMEGRQQQKPANVLTFPLIPHHKVQRRHRRRKLLSSQQQLQKNEKPSHQQSIREYHSTKSLRRTISDSNNVSLLQQTSATLYQGWGTHYVDIWVGVPIPQRLTLIVDTGSSLTAFPCSTCPKNDCGIEPQYHIDTLYNESASISFTKLHCNECFTNNHKCSHNTCIINQKYQEGSSWIAYEAIDTCYIGGSHTIPQTSQTTDTNNVVVEQQKRGHSLIEAAITHDNDNNNNHNEHLFSFGLKFGCQTQLTGLFKEQLADGIMGMDYSSSSFWWQLYESKKIQSRSFSLCYSRHTTTDDIYDNEEIYMNDLYNGLSAGTMSIGGTTDTNSHTSLMIYTDLPKPSTTNKKHSTNPNSMYYQVSIRKMYLRQPIKNDNNNTTASPEQQQRHLYVPIDISQTYIGKGTARVIVDSGTTDTYLPNTIAQQFNNAWKSLMNNEQYNTNQPYKTTISSSIELNNILPTIVLQLRGSIDTNRNILQNYRSTTSTTSSSSSSISPNLVSNIDPIIDIDNPYDVLVYIPPSHYYEYTGTTTTDNGKIYYLYESRFYMNRPKDSGVVLGANTIMGYDVYFDLDNYRIGWAESTCTFVETTNTTTVPVPINNNVPTDTSNSDEKDKTNDNKKVQVPAVAISPTTSPTTSTVDDDFETPNKEDKNDTIPDQKPDDNDVDDDDNDNTDDTVATNDDNKKELSPDGLLDNDTITSSFCTTGSIQCYSLVVLGIVSMIVIAVFVRLLLCRQQQQPKHCQLDQNEKQDDDDNYNDNDDTGSFQYDADDADDFVNGQHHFKDRRFRQHHTYDKVVLPPVD